jgi:hypothetical protein
LEVGGRYKKVKVEVKVEQGGGRKKVQVQVERGRRDGSSLRMKPKP